MKLSSKDWLAKLKNLESPDSTYWGCEPPLIMDRARGAEVLDVEGKAYIDLCAGFGVMALGHSPKILTDYYEEHLNDSRSDKGMPKIIHGMGDVYPSLSKIKFLEVFRSMLPSHLELGMLALSGSQAVEIAIKTSILATGKSGVICFDGSYHGLDLGVLPITSREDFSEPFTNWLRDGISVSLPYECDEDTLQQGIDRLVSAGAGVSSIIVEPIQGRAGVRVPKAGWLEMLKRKSVENGINLIFDEVFTGMGRTGRFTHADEVKADIVAFGKAIGCGFPLSCCFATKEVMGKWPENQGEAIHTGTFFGHPLSCEMGRLVLEYMKSNSIFQRSYDLGQEVVQYLSKKFKNNKRVREVRVEG